MTVRHHYKTLFKRHQKQIKDPKKTHAYIKEHYKERGPAWRKRRWELKREDKGTKGGFKTRFEEISGIEDLDVADAEGDYYTEVPLES